MLEYVLLLFILILGVIFSYDKGFEEGLREGFSSKVKMVCIEKKRWNWTGYEKSGGRQ